MRVNARYLTGLPRITTMKLRPTYATLTADLESSPAFEYLTEEDLLKARCPCDRCLVPP